MVRIRIDAYILMLCAAGAASAVAQRAWAQSPGDLAGTYRVSTDQTTVQIPEWGPDCGPRPASHTGASGRTATVTSNGTQLTIEDGRRHNRTSGCWSDNPEVRAISQSHNGLRWTVICQTPDANYQREQGSYTITADASHITMHEQSEYSWQLRDSRCHATASRTLVYDLVQSAAPQPAVATVDASAAAPTHTPPVNRCATPGAAASLQIAPSRRSLTPGGRVCFHARYLDANHCEVSGAAVTWQITRSSGGASGADAVMENGCVRSSPGSAEGEYTVAAAGGGFSDRAVAAVVSAAEMQSLLASHIEEDDDAGALPTTATSASGSGVGGIVVTVPTTQHANSGVGWLIWVLLGCGVAVGLAGALVLLRRSKSPVPTDETSSSSAPPAPPARQDPSSQSGRQRRDAVPISARELAVEGGIPAKPAVPEARPLTKECPKCHQRFPSEIAFCPEHGVSLVATETKAAPPVAPAPAVGVGAGRVCPRCGQSVPDAMSQCPRDGTPIGSPSLPMMCPVCKKRFVTGTVFCGDDGTSLVEA